MLENKNSPSGMGCMTVTEFCQILQAENVHNFMSWENNQKFPCCKCFINSPKNAKVSCLSTATIIHKQTM